MDFNNFIYFITSSEYTTKVDINEKLTEALNFEGNKWMALLRKSFDLVKSDL